MLYLKDVIEDYELYEIRQRVTNKEGVREDYTLTSDEIKKKLKLSPYATGKIAVANLSYEYAYSPVYGLIFILDEYIESEVKK